MAEDADAELIEKCFGQRSNRHAGRSFTSAGAFQDVAGVVKIVFETAGQVGMAGSRTREWFPLVFCAVDVFHWQRFSPVFPILVADDDRDRRADGLRMPDARNNFDLIGFDLHPPAAPIALLAPPEFTIDGVQRYGNPGREPGKSGDQTFSVRFAGCFEAEHQLGKVLS